MPRRVEGCCGCAPTAATAFWFQSRQTALAFVTHAELEAPAAVALAARQTAQVTVAAVRPLLARMRRWYPDVDERIGDGLRGRMPSQTTTVHQPPETEEDECP